MPGILTQRIADFASADNESDNILRTVTLFGKNSSTYKFALTHALLNQNAQSELRYEDLTESFLQEMLTHYELNPNQYNAGPNSVTKAFDIYCGSYRTSTDLEKLFDATKRTIYNWVFDAYQNVGGGSLEDEYLLFEHVKKSRKLILTDRLTQILENRATKDILLAENQARWRVVEEAWRTKLSPNLITYDVTDGLFYSTSNILQARVGLRSAVETLLPYQHGRCFYCNKDLKRNCLHHDHDFPDVDHFMPFSYLRKSQKLSGANVNGVWNLVIACKECNRGNSGKFDVPPNHKFFKPLLNRNLLFVEEHRHSLKNSIFLSLNVTNLEGVELKMSELYSELRYISSWQPQFYYL